MAQRLVISEAGEIVQPPLHDSQVQGLLLIADKRLLIPVVTSDGTALCLALDGVERLRADDFRQGNIILDVTISVGAAIEVEDVAYAYGLEPNEKKNSAANDGEARKGTADGSQGKSVLWLHTRVHL